MTDNEKKLLQAKHRLGEALMAMKNALTTAAIQNGDWTNSQLFMRALPPVRWNGREASLTAAR